MTIYSSALLLAALATFCAYTVFGKTPDVATALTALALFDIICFPMIMLPQIINSIVVVGISVKCIWEFLLSKEYTVVGEGTLKEKWQNLHEQWNLCVRFKESPFFAQFRSRRVRCGHRKQRGGIKGLICHHQCMMKEVHFVRSWEMLLL